LHYHAHRRRAYFNKNDPNPLFEQLEKYGKVLKHDFSQELPEMHRYVLEEAEAPYNTPKTLEEAIEQKDYWRERYYLERQHREAIEKNKKLINDLL
jgi:hypothetical protein